MKAVTRFSNLGTRLRTGTGVPGSHPYPRLTFHYVGAGCPGEVPVPFGTRSVPKAGTGGDAR